MPIDIMCADQSYKIKKVYCNKCKYLDMKICYEDNKEYPKAEWRYVCGAPQNKGSWLSEDTHYAQFPESINWNNDCSWFEEKEN